MRPHTTRPVAAVIAAALLLTACSSGDEPTDPTTSEPAAATSETATTDGAFPVTLDTVMGQVTIDAKPQRVVTLGSHEHEYLYSLGVAPVAVPVSWQGYDSGSGPWAEADRLAAGAEPETFEPGTTAYDAEAIAAFEPDLIVATYPNHEMTQEEYALLSGVAPVVTRPATDSAGVKTVEWGVSLADELAILGAATGTADKAAAIAAEVEASFEAVRDDHPEWEGKSSTVGFFYEGQAGVYASSDTRNQFLGRLGLNVDAVEGASDAWLPISAEQLDVLGGLDSIVWQVASDPTLYDSITGLPLFASLGTTAKGGHVWITDSILEGAFFANSPSSIQCALTAFVPQLEAALDGDPATEVPPYSD
ncbi:MAG: ABC transporter substrate-binding protein [Propionibacteriaceae bacterium]|nr:ABC transporter substrate-binding protein [Propionibacteriaceae bacterium]